MIRIDHNQDKLRVRVSKTLDIGDICGSKDFNFDRVIDTRQDLDGNTIPVDETLLIRLRNFFTSYEQQSLDLDQASAEEIEGFLNSVEGQNKRTLIITDRAKALGALLRQRKIPACAEVVYFNPMLPKHEAKTEMRAAL